GQLTGRRHVERTDELAGVVRVHVDGLAVAAEPEPVATAEQTEVLVVRLVLLHRNDDVLDLGQRVGALRQAGVWARAGEADGMPGVVAARSAGHPRDATRQCGAGPERGGALEQHAPAQRLVKTVPAPLHGLSS